MAKIQQKKKVNPSPTLGFMRTIKRLIGKIILGFLGISIVSVLFFKWVPIPFTWTMLGQKMQAQANGKPTEIHYTWISFDEISKEAALAVVAAEDQKFPTHGGFDFQSMRQAFVSNAKGKKIRGASTISQQVAKNVFLWQGRSYIRKGLEVYFTLLIEFIWGKERILEVYLNVAETGRMTFGFEEGAQRYFKKSARHLTRLEAAKLAAILPSPRKWSVTNPGPYTANRFGKITRNMRALGGTSYVTNL